MFLLARSVDRDKRFDDKNEENISDEMLLHTFVSMSKLAYKCYIHKIFFQFTDDEKVHGRKRKLRDARIVFEVLLVESNTKWEQELPPKKKPGSLFNMTKVNNIYKKKN